MSCFLALQVPILLIFLRLLFVLECRGTSPEDNHIPSLPLVLVFFFKIMICGWACLHSALRLCVVVIGCCCSAALNICAGIVLFAVSCGAGILKACCACFCLPCGDIFALVPMALLAIYVGVLAVLSKVTSSLSESWTSDTDAETRRLRLRMWSWQAYLLSNTIVWVPALEVFLRQNPQPDDGIGEWSFGQVRYS